MSGLTVALIGFGAMLGLIAIRMPVGLSMLVIGAAGCTGRRAESQAHFMFTCPRLRATILLHLHHDYLALFP